MWCAFKLQGTCGFRAGDTNLYRYVKNNPTNFADPSGLQQEKQPPDYKLLEKPRDLKPEEIAKMKNLYLKFDPKGVTVLGEADPTYNCIAHAVGLKGGVIDSSTPPPGSKIEPPGDWMTGEYIDEVMKYYGFTKSKSVDPERDKIKVVFYGIKREVMERDPVTKMRVRVTRYTIKHAALETGDGKYTSKLGPDLLSLHSTLKILDGDEDQRGAYGVILFAYEKPKPGANPQALKR